MLAGKDWKDFQSCFDVLYSAFSILLSLFYFNSIIIVLSMLIFNPKSVSQTWREGRGREGGWRIVIPMPELRPSTALRAAGKKRTTKFSVLSW
jgi:hypothetical protein